MWKVTILLVAFCVLVANTEGRALKGKHNYKTFVYYNSMLIVTICTS